MSTIANIIVGLVALLHVYILVLEMFLWDKPAGLRAFGQTFADLRGIVHALPDVRPKVMASA